MVVFVPERRFTDTLMTKPDPKVSKNLNNNNNIFEFHNIHTYGPIVRVTIKGHYKVTQSNRQQNV